MLKFPSQTVSAKHAFADLSWQHWKYQVPTWTYPKSEEKPKFAQLIIPTLDSVRFEKLLVLSYMVEKSSLLVSTAQGK